MADSDIAVEFRNVSLNYRVFHERSQSLKATVISKLRRRDNYEIFPALKNVSFQVKKGECVGVIGKNGSGKSTMLKLVANIFSPSGGSVKTFGKVAALLELGAGFHHDLTGVENIFLNGALLGLTRSQVQERFEKIVTFSELDHFIDSPIRHYSSGMYMRLGFSIAINVDPDILLFDEIIAVGDQGFQKKCYDEIFRIKSQGKTMLVVSHSMDTLRRICDTAILLDRGLMLGVGPLEEMIERYAGLY